jgi:putative transposase
VALKHRIDAIFTKYPFSGSRRITAQLRREGKEVNRKAVQRHMREMGVAGIGPGPNLSRRAHGEQVYPYLLRDLTCSYPNQVWGIDITYIPLQTSWMYLVAVLDWFSRYVVSWELDDSLQLPFVLSAVKRALAQAKPLIWNSDQGSHFTSPQYRELLLAAEVQISMDGKGRALDNIFVERLWRSVKYEEVYLNNYVTPRDARMGLSRYLAFLITCDRIRRSTIGHRSRCTQGPRQRARHRLVTGERCERALLFIGQVQSRCIRGEVGVYHALTSHCLDTQSSR